ncbi:MAG TPA: FG-GAP-like repeat-containing protein [Rhodanobacteraceae bacterium]
MSNRSIVAAAALTAVVGLSASIAVSLGSDAKHPTLHPAALSSAGASRHAQDTKATAAMHAGSSAARPNRAAATGAAAATLAGAGALGAGSNSGTGPSASTPTLVTTQGSAHTLAQGAQKATPVSVSEDQAMQAIFKGGMWLPNATGGREYAKYDHHLVHDNGDWTWVGKVQTAHGLQSAVITFGKNAVFGRIPQASGDALRLVTADGQKLLVQTDGSKMAASAVNRQLYAHQDFKVPHHRAVGSSTRAASATTTRTATAASAQTTASASTSGGPTIDVMVAYTSGFASAQGSTSAALTRINNLVDVANQAYADSGVNQRIRLVHTMQVSYTDTNDDTKALDDVTGNDGNGNSVPVPSALQGIASARAQYGADLVVLLRKFNNAGNNGCGVGWLIGGGEQGIIPSEDNAFGYSVVQDGSDAGYYCLDSTFAHELGHNMGSAHDRANSTQPGAYAYSYGYRGNGVDGFATIMSYGGDTQTPLNLFSNPNLSTCQNSPCGVADSSTSSADNVHSLNNTASLIAQFEPTKVSSASGGSAHNDVNGDSKSDLLWRSTDNARFAYWIMSGATLTSSRAFGTATNLQIVATGDFNGDGNTDIIWTDGASLWMWVGNGSAFTSTYMRPYPGGGWKVVGTADVNADGKSDLLWLNASNTLATWLMNGTSFSATYSQSMAAGWRFLAAGDFDGGGEAGVLWTNGTSMAMWMHFNSGIYKQVSTHAYPQGWTFVGAGDVNGDGKSDLIWRDTRPSSSRAAYWVMNGPTLVRSWSTPVGGASWSIGELADLNGDGLLDVVWYNANSIVLWVGDGTSFHNELIHSYPTGWAMQK